MRPQTWINNNGYITVKHPITGSLHKAHRVIWHLVHGEHPPERWHVHHCDKNKVNNRPDNLEAMPWPEHKRTHERHTWHNGCWHKSCRTCGFEQPEYLFPTKSYQSNGTRKTRGNCRDCDRKRVYERKYNRPHPTLS